MKRKLGALAMALLFALTLIPTAVFANTDVVEGDKGNEVLTYNTNKEVTLKNVTIEADENQSAISIEAGNVTLVLVGNNVLKGGDNGAGIYVAEGASLTIKGTGTLTAIGNADADDNTGAAGIGGTWANGNSGAITIDGATVIAKGYGTYGSGIGSGSGKVVGEIKILNGANVTAYGGYYADGAGTKLQTEYGKKDPEGGAAIGGGAKTVSTVAAITISDSTVTAYGGSKAAGIGANFWSSVEKIEITGSSNVTAQGGSSSAGIGTSRAGDHGVSANIIISGGTVAAAGGDYGAGIGAGYNADALGNGQGDSALPETSVTISGGTVQATGGMGGAGIGGGYKTDNVDIDITGGTVRAAAGPLVEGKTVSAGGAAAAIGTGANGSGVFENAPAVEVGQTASVQVWSHEGGKTAIHGVADDTLSSNVTRKVVTTGSITYGYTSEQAVWGEGGANCTESFVVELYAGAEKIATASLNNVGGIIDGTVYVTWSIPFAGSSDEYWNVTWEAGHPNTATQPTKVMLYADGLKVAENTVQMNGPDNLNPVVWSDIEAVVNATVAAPAPVYGGPAMNWVKVNSADNGVVKSGPLAASEGATITLYPKAAAGYVLDTVEVLDAEGNAIQLNGLKFRVPLGGVTVNATFKPAN